MRRLDIGSNNAGVMSVDLSKEKNSPNLEGSSSILQRSNQNNGSGGNAANDSRSPLGQLQSMGRNRRSYSLVTSLERL